MNTRYINEQSHIVLENGKPVEKLVRNSKVGCDQHYRLGERYGRKIMIYNSPDAKIPQLFDVVATEPTDEACLMCKSNQEARALQEARMPEVKEALLSPLFRYTRFRYSQVHIYHRDDRSPTGVMLATSIDPEFYDKVVEELKKEGRTLHGGFSPLSPTEGR